MTLNKFWQPHHPATTQSTQLSFKLDQKVQPAFIACSTQSNLMQISVYMLNFFLVCQEQHVATCRTPSSQIIVMMPKDRLSLMSSIVSQPAYKVYALRWPKVGEESKLSITASSIGSSYANKPRKSAKQKLYNSIHFS